MIESITTIDLSPIWPIVLQIASGVLLALGIWALKKFISKLSLESDEKIRKYLIHALYSGISYGKNKALLELSSDDWTKPDVKDVVLAQAITYTITRVPDAVKKFKLTEEDIKDLILARLEK